MGLLYDIFGVLLLVALLLEAVLRNIFEIVLLPIVLYIGFKTVANKHYFLNTLFVMGLTFFTRLVVFPNQFQWSLRVESNLERYTNMPMPKIDLVDALGKPFVFEPDITDILDFWFDECGICFKEFSLLEKLA